MSEKFAVDAPVFQVEGSHVSRAISSAWPKRNRNDWYAGYMQQEITSAIFLTLKGYGKVKLAWASPRRRRLFKYPLPYFPN